MRSATVRQIGPVINPDEPDIGMCDYCGSEDGPRNRRIRQGTFNGIAQRVVAWVCPECEADMVRVWVAS